MSIVNRIFNIFRKSKTKDLEWNCILKGNVHILPLNGGTIKIHPSVLLNSNPIGYHVAMPFDTTLIADRPESLINIEENCRIHGAYIHAWRSINIGKGVLIAAGTTIVDSNGHSSDIRYARFRRNFNDEAKEIIIEDFVWIGMNCIILKGVTVGEGSIVSAGAVVRDNVPPFSIVEGNPAKVVKQFNPEDALLENHLFQKLKLEKGYYECEY
jgi:acetyltransferase-like isoleucine patch superfamily enzyme